MVSLVVLPASCGEQCSRPSRPAEKAGYMDEVDALVPVKHVLTRSDENVEKDTVILSAGMEQKAPRSVSWRCDETTSAMVKLVIELS